MKCGKQLGREEQEYCRDCGKFPYAYERGYSLWNHRDPVSKAVYQFKYHNRRCYGAIFAQEMAAAYEKQIREWEIAEIIPVPLHPARKRKRGYNQSEILAEELGKRIGIPVNGEAVIRIRNTRPQKELDNRERIRNLKGAFAVSKKWDPKESVLILDDIYTTGNTIHRIADILKKAGAQKVYFLTISIGQGL